MSEFVIHPDWKETGGWLEAASTDDRTDELFGHVIEDVTVESADRNEIVLVGEPFDRAVIGRSGASDGPTEIRKALARTKTAHFEHGRVRSIGDLGDVDSLVTFLEQDIGHVEPVEMVHNRLQGTTAAVHDLDALPVFLGGDNSLTFPNVAPLLDRGSVGVINLDAHLDVRDVREDATSGTPYRQLFEAGLDGYACLGARHFETSHAYREYVHRQGGTVITADELGENPVGAAAMALESLRDVEYVYVSVDCDVLDASAAPGVSAPTPGGITTRELYRILGRLARDERIAGFEIVECAPPLDRDGMTVDAAARAVAHFLAGYQGQEVSR